MKLKHFYCIALISCEHPYCGIRGLHFIILCQLLGKRVVKDYPLDALNTKRRSTTEKLIKSISPPHFYLSVFFVGLLHQLLVAMCLFGFVCKYLIQQQLSAVTDSLLLYTRLIVLSVFKTTVTITDSSWIHLYFSAESNNAFL